MQECLHSRRLACLHDRWSRCRRRARPAGPRAPEKAAARRHLEDAGIPTFGPSRAASVLEGSKAFTKDLCARHGIPTAAYGRFAEPAPDVHAPVSLDDLGTSGDSHDGHDNGGDADDHNGDGHHGTGDHDADGHGEGSG